MIRIIKYGVWIVRVILTVAIVLYIGIGAAAGRLFGGRGK